MSTLSLPGLSDPKEGSREVKEGWAVDPTPEDIKNTLQPQFPNSDINVEFFSSGAYNKLYQVTIDVHKTYLLRVSLPVDPVHKTSSEIATLRFVAAISNIPIPRPVMFCTHQNTPTGLEWIMMTKLDGVTLHNIWPRLDAFQKIYAVRQIASFQFSLFSREFCRIGNLYPETSLEPQRIVSIPFFQGGRAWKVNNRGPFPNSSQWIYARLNLQRRDAWHTITKYNRQKGGGSLTQEDYDRALYTCQLGRRIFPFIARFFPEDGNALEETVLHHDDLHANNILANDLGAITGIVDWECVSTVPLWKACFYPKFLYAPPRHTPEESSFQDPEFLASQDNLLRSVFLAEMERMSPVWMQIYRTSACKRDLSFAVDKIGSEDKQPYIASWLSNLESDQAGPGLLDTLFEL
ncbi:kinase-like domain-containing protein [Fusarium avenaceum]|nr:kinase-like domain-containing protein [Fusarium avenaceum]